MDDAEIKRRLMRLIGDSIDEASLDGVDSFIEMEHAVIHFAGADGDRYFRVTLTETTEAEYFNPLNEEPE